jgi:hypothetical protein
MAYRVSQPEEFHINKGCKGRGPEPATCRNRASVLDLYQIKGGLRLYLLLDLDY